MAERKYFPSVDLIQLGIIIHDSYMIFNQYVSIIYITIFNRHDRFLPGSI